MGQMENGHVKTTKSLLDKNFERERSPQRVFIELLVSKRFFAPFISYTDGGFEIVTTKSFFICSRYLQLRGFNQYC